MLDKAVFYSLVKTLYSIAQNIQNSKQDWSMLYNNAVFSFQK